MKFWLSNGSWGSVFSLFSIFFGSFIHFYDFLQSRFLSMDFNEFITDF